MREVTITTDLRYYGSDFTDSGINVRLICEHDGERVTDVINVDDVTASSDSAFLENPNDVKDGLFQFADRWLELIRDTPLFAELLNGLTETFDRDDPLIPVTATDAHALGVPVGTRVRRSAIDEAAEGFYGSAQYTRCKAG